MSKIRREARPPVHRSAFLKVTTCLFHTSHGEGLLVLVVTLAGLAGLLIGADRWTQSNPHFALGLDHQKYLYMASHGPFDFHIAPFGWRVLTPLIASKLPFEIATSFSVVSFAALWLTGTVLYFTLKKMGFSKTLAFIGLVFFMTLGWATKFNLEDFWLGDALGFLFATAAIWSIYTGKDLCLVLILAIGVLAKESVIFVTPLWYTVNAPKLFDARLLRRQLMIAAPAILVLILVRVAISPLNGDAQYLATLPQILQQDARSPYDVGTLLADIGLPRIRQISISDLYEYSLGTFGLWMSVLALFAVRGGGDEICWPDSCRLSC